MKAAISDFQAVGLALAGFTFWVLADTSIKIAGNARLPVYEIIAFLGLFVAAFLFLRGVFTNSVASLWPKDSPKQFVRSCLDLGNNLGVVVALRHLPLALFYILIFMSPMVTSILAALFLNERLKWRTALAISGGFLGVVIAVDPFNSARPGDWMGYAACGLCVVCFSTNMVWSRVITQTENPESLAFCSGIVSSIAGFAFMLWHAEPLSVGLSVVLVAMGVFAAVGSLCFFIALKHTSAANVSQYHYTQLLTGALLAYLIWHEKPNLPMLLGGTLIIGSGLYIAVHASGLTLRSVSESE